MNAPEPMTALEGQKAVEILERIEAKLDLLLAHHGIEYEGSGS
jgi:putative NIF3 family GTP cyclohydrolase 1 type 2